MNDDKVGYFIGSLSILQHDLKVMEKSCGRKRYDYIKAKEDALKALKNAHITEPSTHRLDGYVQEMMEAEKIDSFFGDTYRYLAMFDVPMSWIACLKIQPVFDHMGSYWRVHQIKLMRMVMS